jgi:phage terminase Nu1 subunit (DNA packaging protein)
VRIPAGRGQQRALARALRVDADTIHSWDERYPREQDGSVDVEKVRRWRREKNARRAQRGPEQLEPNALKGFGIGNGDDEAQRALIRYRTAKAAEAVLKLQVLRGKLVERASVRMMLVARATEFRRALLSMGRRLAPELVGADLRAIQTRVEQAIAETVSVYERDPHLKAPELPDEITPEGMNGADED